MAFSVSVAASGSAAEGLKDQATETATEKAKDAIPKPKVPKLP